jgi:phosphate:Na+ symporter
LDMTMLISLMGGLGLFLYGMKMMGDGLENAAGNKLKFILEKVTSNPLKAVMVGTAVTMLIQSSSATTVMVVGFVNSGLLNLVQATGIIMGANIGTTVTAFLVSLNVDAIVPAFLFVGSVMMLVSQAKKRKDIASIILGFGVMMLGMSLMSDAMYPLRDSKLFRELILSLGNQWYLGLLLGLGITLLIQSSSATTGILVALTNTGNITIQIAFPIILGANIGTCITALLSSITANKTAKKAAVIHLLFNVIGTLIFLPFGGVLIKLVTWISPVSVKYQISFIHLFFNGANTLILLPFRHVLINLANRIVGEDVKTEAEILDRRLLQTPTIAEGQVVLETVKLAELAKKNVQLATEAFLTGDLSQEYEIMKNEDRINEVTEIITNFLVELSATDVNIEEFRRIGNTYHVINDIERIGDHAENILELAVEKSRKEAELTPEGMAELREIFQVTEAALDISISSYKENDQKMAMGIDAVESKIDALQKEYRQSHIKRLQKGRIKALSSILFLDVVSNLERVGDHAKNMADVVAGIQERD